MGGSSSERDVSIKTGNAVIASLSNKYSNINSIDVSFDKSDRSFLDKIGHDDIVFNALHGGSGENGDVQAMLEMKGFSYTGSNSKASKICMDKNLSKTIADKEGLNVPKWILVKNNNKKKYLLDCRENNEKVSYPIIVKPNSEGSTMGLAKANDFEEMNSAVSKAFEFSEEVMVEEYIVGREITVGVLGDRALPIVEIFPKKDFFDYECKYSKGMSTYDVPAKIDKELAIKIQKDAFKIHESIGCRHYSRVDFILGNNDNYYFLEINSLPGMTSTSLLPMAAKSAGMNFDELIDTILNMTILNND